MTSPSSSPSWKHLTTTTPSGFARRRRPRRDRRDHDAERSRAGGRCVPAGDGADDHTWRVGVPDVPRRRGLSRSRVQRSDRQRPDYELSILRVGDSGARVDSVGDGAMTELEVYHRFNLPLIYWKRVGDDPREWKGPHDKGWNDPKRTYDLARFD